MAALWRAMSGPRRALWIGGLVGLALAQIGQPYPQVAVLHHAPTLLFFLAFPWASRRIKLSDRAWLCVFAFLAIHTLGGRYTYTNTPYDAWFEAVIGHGLNEVMGWERNHYDRLAHFAFGLLMVAPISDLWRHHAKQSTGLALALSAEFVLGVSAVYEIFEWLLSIYLAPGNVEAYNGQQGDIWDPQKDMALAFLGALISVFWLRITGKNRSPE